MLTVRSNHLSAFAQNASENSRSSLGVAIQRLSSGLRINSARDDAAGLAISNRMTANLRGLQQANRNANDAVSLAQTAHGALDEVNERLQRVRELTVYGLTETLSLEDHDTVQAEINLNLKEIDRLAVQTSFNGVPLLNGKAGRVDFQIGAYDKQTLGVNLGVPGFSVEAMSLVDFVVWGLDGSAEHVDTVSGTAYRIPIVDPSTALTYSATAYGETPFTESQLEFVSSPVAGGTDYFIRASDPGGRPTYYVGTAIAHHLTETGTNTVRISPVNTPAQRLFEEVTDVPARAASLQFVDATSSPLSGNFQLSRGGDGRHYIKDIDTSEYYAAELHYGTTGAATVVQSGGPIPAPDDIVDGITQVPSIDLEANDVTVAFTDANGATVDGRLLRKDGSYVVEVDTGSGYEYFGGSLAVHVNENGAKQLTATASPAIVQTFNVVNRVTGTSTADIDPARVTVNYVDESGKVHANVLRPGPDGSYIFNLGSSEKGGSKTGTLVRHENGDYYVKTVNGSGEVILYYPTSPQAITYADGTPPSNTTLTIREDGPAIRLRTKEPLALLDRALAHVDAKRSELGAFHNRLESIVNTNANTIANTAAARSRISDADYAVEVSNMTRSQILQQASHSVLVQANQVPQAVLSLLT